MIDPRGNIYNFLGLATDIQESDIQPDYGSSSAKMYTNCTKFLFTRNQPRDLLPLKLFSASHCCILEFAVKRVEAKKDC
jgi:hypothetical protein